VKCRPPGNREPEPDEIAACASYLDRQIEVVDPRVIVTLGRFSMARGFPGVPSAASTALRSTSTAASSSDVPPAAALHRGDWPRHEPTSPAAALVAPQLAPLHGHTIEPLHPQRTRPPRLTLPPRTVRIRDSSFDQHRYA